jgi:hypothetical protein
MTDTWDGRPQNSERDGCHWLLGWNNTPFVAEWDAASADWSWAGGDESCVGVVAAGWRYLGPCLTPAEVEARVAEARREALEEAAEWHEDRAHNQRKNDRAALGAFHDAAAAAIRALKERT